MRHDLRYALHTLAGAPGFTFIALLALALGIGANTAMFSVVNAVLLRPLPFQDADRLVLVWERSRQLGEMRTGPSGPNYLDWKKTESRVRGDFGPGAGGLRTRHRTGGSVRIGTRAPGAAVPGERHRSLHLPAGPAAAAGSGRGGQLLFRLAGRRDWVRCRRCGMSKTI
jgi:hypothetical protein